MSSPVPRLPLLPLFLLFITHSQSNTSSTAETTTTSANISSCLLSSRVQNFTLFSSPPSIQYSNLLNFSIQNLRFACPSVHKPSTLILPNTQHELQSSIVCCRSSSLTIRLRSGGHSYEGLSYTAGQHTPFAIIDLMNLNRVWIDSGSSTAWAESGATVGEIYHAVARSKRPLAFSAGTCSTVGSGGLISGGGFGFLSRKYGLAADNVLDAVLIDPAGRALDRKSMGEDVFWAIRGGGGGSFGAVYAWKLRLVPVPDRVTVCSISRPGSVRKVAELTHKWQYVAPNLPDEFFLSKFIQGSTTGNLTNKFLGLFLGPKGTALSILRQRFPELAVSESECNETSWIESAVRFTDLKSVSDLLNREPTSKKYFKAKSDYVRAPITMEGLITAVDLLSKQPKAFVFFDPYGGEMGRIASGDLPFPHRRGNLYGIQYVIHWNKGEDGMAYVAWIRRLYEYMGRFVSKNPRVAFVNFVDLDLGTIQWTTRSGGSWDAVGVARAWGERYFLGNYDRLVRAKTAIDPDNVFRNEQSIPPLPKGGS
ncbi:berberine bridge enzyme-like A [Elaeis guineensis]|uniref:Reticuline oxidase-like n=1 Tax=Elaeis guineensis var. tenera TaxID=51953 RepID=A0A6I9SDF0_ELAGV|nr:reticuline oxidase-like [Elaeis guineensis]